MTNKLFEYKIITGDDRSCRGPAHFAKTGNGAKTLVAKCSGFVDWSVADLVPTPSNGTQFFHFDIFLPKMVASGT